MHCLTCLLSLWFGPIYTAAGTIERDCGHASSQSGSEEDLIREEARGTKS